MLGVLHCAEYPDTRWGIKTPNCGADAQFMSNGTSNSIANVLIEMAQEAGRCHCFELNN